MKAKSGKEESMPSTTIFYKKVTKGKLVTTDAHIALHIIN